MFSSIHWFDKRVVVLIFFRILLFRLFVLVDILVFGGGRHVLLSGSMVYQDPYDLLVSVASSPENRIPTIFHEIDVGLLGNPKF